jgi:regulator of protease activity HflC (stomatin/prohibitin superfamily)
MSKNVSVSPNRLAKKVVIGVVGGLIGLMLFSGAFFTVGAGERALVLRFGQVQQIVGDGLHVKLPLVDDIIRVDIRTQKSHAPATAGTRDLQTVTTEVALNYHLQAASLKDTYTRFGLDIEEKVIAPRIQEIVKAVIARFSAEELLVRRDVVKSEIANGLRQSLSHYNVVVEDIQITNFSFSQAFDEAIEAKQTAEQNALKAKNDLERIRVEAEQKIAMAQAEAEAIRIQAQAIKEQGGEAYVRMKAIEKWDGVLPQVSGGATPFINLNTQANAPATPR